MKHSWQALVLAAGRGPDDPMARAYGVSHKCTLPVLGKPMLSRVITTLLAVPEIKRIAVSIEDEAPLHAALGNVPSRVNRVQSTTSAPASVLAAVRERREFPLLLTTGDHALLTPEMVDYFCTQASNNSADFSVGLATAETILKEYPESVRTFFRLGADRVSGCNLFAIMNERGLAVVERWQYLDSLRKKPWRLVAAFGLTALLRFAFGAISLDSAFQLVSKQLNVVARAVLMPFAEAAIDVDKPSDLELAERILRQRQTLQN